MSTPAETKPDPSTSAASTKKRGGLGRGLSALIPQAAAAAGMPAQHVEYAAPPDLAQAPAREPTPAEKMSAAYLRAPRPAPIPAPADESGSMRMISLRAITLNPNQPRKMFGKDEIEELTESIREHGVIQPILVRFRPGSGAAASFELVAGERRFRAASAAGLTEIPAVVRGDIDDRDSLALALIENIQREDLNTIEAAQAYDELLTTYSMTQSELARIVGRSQAHVSNTLRMLQLPAAIQVGLRDGRITEGHAKAILSLADESRQSELYQRILSLGLSVRQAEKEAAELKKRAAGVRTVMRGGEPRTIDPQLEEISRKISLSMGTRVRFVPGKGQRGVIEIAYFDHDQLEGLIERLTPAEIGAQR